MKSRKDKNQEASFRLAGDSGFTLIELLITAAMAGFIGLSAVTVANLVNGSTLNGSSSMNLDQIRRNVVTIISSDAAMKNIVSDSVNSTASMACLFNGTACGAGGPIRILDQNNAVAVDLGPNMGLTPNGDVCNTFNPAVPDRTCPYQLLLNWTPQCAGGAPSCTNPLIVISGAFTVATTNASDTINTSRYGITLYRSYIFSVPSTVQLATGADFACALSVNNQVKCWGNNSLGQLGRGTSATPANTPDFVVDTTNTPLANIVEISAGDDFACAVRNDKTAWCWGNNYYGQLGINRGPTRIGGDTDYSPAAQQVFMGVGGDQVDRLVAGKQAACMRTTYPCVHCGGRLGKYDLVSTVGNPFHPPRLRLRLLLQPQRQQPPRRL